MKPITGKYSNGANQINGMYHAYDDCDNCMGNGYVERAGHYMNWNIYQCPKCEARFGNKEYIKRRINAIISHTESIMRREAKENGWSFAKTKRLNEDAFDWVEDFAINDPLAIEYRRLLVRYWSYVEPELLPA